MFENYDHVLNQLKAFGLVIGHLDIGTAVPVRCAVDTNILPAKKASRKSAGWYHLSTLSLNGKDYIIGAYGFWKGADNNKQTVELGQNIQINPEQKKAMQARWKAMEKAAKKAQLVIVEGAAKKAQYIWSCYIKEGTSDYLIRKGVQAHGLRFDPKGKGTVAVPVMCPKGKIYGLQLIRSDAAVKGSNKIQKKFEPKGLAVSGHFHLIGPIPTSVILIAEGYATAATIYKATHQPTVVAFNANNLVPVAKSLKKKYPNATILVCADDDYLTEGNPGITWAEKAANAVSGKVVVPSFKNEAGQDIRNGEKLTDFNDLANNPQGGQHTVRTQLENALQGININPAAHQPKPNNNTVEPNDYQAQSVMAIDDMAERYIFLEDGTGKTFYDKWSRNFILKTQVETQLPDDNTFNDLKSHPIWSSRALKPEQVAFDPTGKDKKVIENRWNGLKIKNPKLEDPLEKCTLAMGLLKYLTEKEDPTGKLFNWVLDWLAYPIQNPGAKMDSCLVFKGAQGTGKGFLFVQILGELYGEYFASLTQSALEDKFNSDWSDRKLFIVADEVVASTEKYKYKNQLKTLISEPVIRVNPKNMAAYQERNHFNLVFLSNEAVPVILENDDRRHCVIETPEKLPQDYYYKLQEEVDAGGIAALYQFLLELDLGDFNQRSKPPMTNSKSELIDLGLDSHERFIKDWLAGKTDYPVVPITQKNLYRAYSQWNNEEGERYRHPAKDLKPVLRKYGVHEKLADIYSSFKYEGFSKKTARLYEPSESLYARLLEQGLPWKYKPQNKTLTEWRTDGNLEFEKVLEELA